MLHSLARAPGKRQQHGKNKQALQKRSKEASFGNVSAEQQLKPAKVKIQGIPIEYSSQS